MAPRIYWTTDYQNRMNATKAANHAYWTRMVNQTNSANSPSTSSQRIAAAVYYALSGDSQFFEDAWNTAIKSKLDGATYHTTNNGSLWSIGDPAGESVPDGSRNFTREAFIDYVVIYDWLKPLLSASRKTQFINSLNFWVDLCVFQSSKTIYNLDGTVKVNAGWGSRLSPLDSDEVTGHYFGCILWALVSIDDNTTRANEILNGVGKYAKIGGLTQTSTSSNSTMRNAIYNIVVNKSNGSWVESSQYDYGTMRLLLKGVLGVQTITGIDYFPEVTSRLKRMAYYNILLSTPDRQDAFKYGDVEEAGARNLISDRRRPMGNNLLAALYTDPTIGPYLNDFILTLGTSSTIWEDFVFGHPTSTRTTYTTGMPQGFVDTKRALLAYHDNWADTASSAFYVFGSLLAGIDHNGLEALTNWGLYRAGKWMVSHQIGYDTSSTPNVSKSANVMTMAGMSRMQEGLLCSSAETSTDFAYMSCSTGGCRYRGSQTAVPNRFVHEHTDSYVYLPSTTGAMDVVITLNRINCDDPTSVTNSANYVAEDDTAIAGAAQRKQWHLHSPVVPTIGTSTITWANTGQTIECKMHLPEAANRVASSGTVGWGTVAPPLSEQNGPGKYRIRIGETPNVKMSTFVNVIQAYATIPATSTLVQDTTGTKAVGVRITRTGHNDYVVLGNATAGPNLPSTDTSGTYTPNLNGDVNTLLVSGRVRTTGYTVSYTATTTTSKMLFLDLDPTLTWNATVDGGAATSLGVTSSTPVGKLTVSGASSHTIVVAVGGAPPGDTTAPVVALTTPADLATVSNTVTVAATATDAVGVVGVQFKLDGVNLGAEVTTGVADSYSLAWDTTGASNGTHTLTAVARDAASNSTTSSSRTVTVSNAVDVTAPGVTVAFPLAGTTLNGTVTVQATASDAGGVVGVQFRLDGANLGVQDTVTPFSTDWNTLSTTNTAHTLSAIATDIAGNTTNAVNVVVVVNNTSPAVDAGLITNVSSVAAGSNVIAILSTGQLLYTDRVYTVTTLPVYLNNVPYIRTANGDRSNTSPNYLTVTINSDATAFVIFNGTDTVPGWLSAANGWRLMAETVTSTDVDGDPRKVYARAQSAGAFALGGKSAPPGNPASTESNFFAAVVPLYTAIVTPTANAVVSGTASAVTATVSSSQNIVSVTLYADGVVISSTDTTAPYSLPFNTQTLGNGAHDLQAVAQATDTTLYYSLPVSVTVNNSLADTTPPTLTGTTALSISEGSALVSWTANELSTARVYFGGDTLYGFPTVSNLRVAPLLLANSLLLSDLAPLTTYHYYAESIDSAGNVGSSTDLTFTTPDQTPPVLSAHSTGIVTTASALVFWTTDELTDTRTDYSTDLTFATTSALDTALITAHSVQITGLTAATLYNYRTRSADSSGNVTTSAALSFTTVGTNDAVAPVIAGTTARNITDDTADIAWNTDEASDSTVFYGLDTAYGTSVTNVTDVILHTVALSSLESAVTYHYYVSSDDPTGNTGSSTDLTFVTAAPLASLPTVGISQISIQEVTRTSARVSWVTDSASTSTLDFGTTTAYNDVSSPVTVSSGYATTHAVLLSNLDPDTTYYIRLVSVDTNGNIVSSPPDPDTEHFFTTHERVAVRRFSTPGRGGHVRYSRR